MKTKLEFQQEVWKNPLHFLAFGFGMGLLPKAPGTFGTAIAIPFYLMLAKFSWPVYISVTGLLFIFGIWLCHIVERDVQIPDCPGIVWDEIVGFLITMIFIPVQWKWIIMGFLWFRFFDILKPWPIKIFEKYFHGGFGIMIDDAIAALYAWMVLQIFLYFFF